MGSNPIRTAPIGTISQLLSCAVCPTRSGIDYRETISMGTVLIGFELSGIDYRENVPMGTRLIRFELFCVSSNPIRIIPMETVSQLLSCAVGPTESGIDYRETVPMGTVLIRFEIIFEFFSLFKCKISPFFLANLMVSF